MNEDQILNIGFIGAGRVADVHYDALIKCKDVAKLASFCDIREEAVTLREREWKVPGYSSVDSMLENTVLDGVVVMLPHNTHLEVMKKCLSKKLPVLLEKPLAGNLREARMIARLTEDSGIPVLVGHNGLFHPAQDKFVKFVQDGWIGKPLTGSARSLQWLFFKPWDFRLSRDKTGGGAWVDCAGHLIYRLNAVLGKIAGVKGFTSHLARKEMEGEDTAAAVLQYQSGAIAQVAVSYGCKIPNYEKDWPEGCEQMLMVSGDKGMVEYHICPSSHLRFYTEKEGCSYAKAGTWTEIEIEESFEKSFDLQMEHFLDCVKGNTQPKVSVREAEDLLKVMMSLY